MKLSNGVLTPEEAVEYNHWRITFQSDSQAARALSLQVKELSQQLSAYRAALEVIMFKNKCSESFDLANDALAGDTNMQRGDDQ